MSAMNVNRSSVVVAGGRLLLGLCAGSATGMTERGMSRMGWLAWVGWLDS